MRPPPFKGHRNQAGTPRISQTATDKGIETYVDYLKTDLILLRIRRATARGRPHSTRPVRRARVNARLAGQGKGLSEHGRAQQHVGVGRKARNL
jgi:hypothetical protein